MIRNRIGGMCAAALMLAALFVGPVDARAQSTVIAGALCVSSTSAPPPAVVDILKPAQVYVNVGVYSSDARTYAGQLLIVVMAGSDHSLTATCRVDPKLPITYQTTTTTTAAVTTTTTTAHIPFIGSTQDGRIATGTFTVTLTDPVKHRGSFSFTETIKSATTSTSIIASDQPCDANVIAPSK